MILIETYLVTSVVYLYLPCAQFDKTISDMNRISIQQMEFENETYPNMNTTFSLWCTKSKNDLWCKSR